ncbi:segregation/condensation protein A [Fervidibacillus halotolerans]|uniref:Segregation and condensation protein A n=1 Tax=Fervidibacillus halotolerans TaxID=2980027 RepID=A0A9E8M1I5_9BACI|nr:segregation/condensation protein A [Fervidibacillus halotolerans]WAA13808.1 segregation/condensation protein A [Fervidibacillus halotolerans]
MEMKIKTGDFEGPLDLLLHLIKQLEIDIYDIPMAEITEQYMQYIHTMQELQLDIASEYLVMAATLLAIKSEMLLPKYDDVEEQVEFEDEFENDPREELVARLIEYRKYKEAANHLKEKEKQRAMMFTKPPSDLSEYASSSGSNFVGKRATIYDMLGAYHKLLRRQRLEKPLHTKVVREEVSIEKRMEEVMNALKVKKEMVHFEELLTVRVKKIIVVTFLAILELMKRNIIVVQQKDNFDDIWIISIQSTDEFNL